MNNSGYKKNKIKSGRPKLLKDDEYKKILEHSYNGEIDINWIINNLNISKSTAYRTMQELNLTHASESTIATLSVCYSGAVIDKDKIRQRHRDAGLICKDVDDELEVDKKILKRIELILFFASMCSVVSGIIFLIYT